MVNNKTRIILTVACVGKTYLDKNYSNVYDFDKHTLDYKYERKGFENISNEEFKGLPNRRIKDNWFELYMNDWCSLIESNKYDIITGWLNNEAINYLLEKGYELEIVVVSDNTEIFVKRSIERGNSSIYAENLINYYNKVYEEYKDDKRMKVWVLNKDMYLSELIETTGSKLIKNIE